jgi:hypothetical protein
MDELIIHIYEASDEGYMYDIFTSEDAQQNGDAIDGGQCTTTLANALEMATDQAKALLF